MKIGKAETIRLKEWAKLLYTKDNRTQKDVAATVGVSTRTVNVWVADGKWDELQKSLMKTKDEQLKDLYNQLNEFNTYIKSKNQGLRFPDSKEGDALSKLTKAIKDLESELKINIFVDVFIEFSDWLRPIDFKKAQEFTQVFDEFIKQKID